MAKLIVQDGPSKGDIYELSGEPMVVGSDPMCDIVLPDATAAPRHARIAREDDGWTLADLGSQEGTAVNGTRVERHVLAPLDEVKVGETLLVFEPDDLGAGELPADDGSWVQPAVAETVGGERLKLLSRGQVAHSPEEVSRINDGLITLFRYATLAPQARTLRELLDALGAAVREALAPDRVVPILLEPESGAWRPWLRTDSALDRKLAQVPVCRAIIQFVFEERLSALGHAPAEEPRLGQAPSAQANRISSAMCVPLRAGEALLGAIYADRLGEGEPFTRNDLELLTALALPTAAAIQGLRAAERLRRECQALERQARTREPFPGDLASIEDVERAHILRVLERMGGNKTEAAQVLRIDRSTLYARLKAIELTRHP